MITSHIECIFIFAPSIFYHRHLAIKFRAFQKNHPHWHLPLFYPQVPPTYSSVRLHSVICWQSELLWRHLCKWCFLL